MRIVSGSDDQTIRVWSARSGVADEEFLPLLEHGGYISSVAFSPDGKHIVSGSSDSTIRIWDAKSLKKYVPSLMARTSVQCVQSLAFSPDGKRIACGAGRTITLCDTASGAQVLQLQGHQSAVLSVTFSPDGRYIVSGSEDKTVRVWDTQTGLETLEPLQGHQHPITSLAYAPDGFYIVSASDDRVIHVWNALSGAKVMPAIHGHPKWVPLVALHLSPVRIAAALSGDIICPSELVTTYSLASIVDHNDIQVDIFIPRHVGSGWIVDVKAHKRNLCKLPPSISVNAVMKSTSRGRSIVIGTRSGRVVIMHFPLAIWERPEMGI
jgi:WD40 repeat protein